MCAMNVNPKRTVKKYEAPTLGQKFQLELMSSSG